MLKKVIGAIRALLYIFAMLVMVYIAVFVTLIYLELKGYDLNCRMLTAEHRINLDCIGSIKP